MSGEIIMECERLMERRGGASSTRDCRFYVLLGIFESFSKIPHRTQNAVNPPWELFSKILTLAFPV
jgi:hypothetical protein